MNTAEFTIPMLLSEYAFLYHKAQLATEWED